MTNAEPDSPILSAQPTAANAAPAPEEILIVNERSGPGTPLPDWLAALPSVPAGRLDEALTRATAGEHPVRLIVWGGDGTVRAAAKAVVGTSSTLLPAPGGTHNHFALHVGIASVDDLAAARDIGSVRRLDVGYVNSELFLNNASVGWYVELVRRRERLEARLPRRLAKIVSTVTLMFRTHRIALVIDGVAVVAWMVWIGNGRYDLEPTRLAERPDLRDGLLDVRVLPADGRFHRLKAVIALMRREVGDHPSLRRWTATSVELRPRGGANRLMRVACDGEVVTLRSPLRFRCAAGVLRTVVGPERA